MMCYNYVMLYSCLSGFSVSMYRLTAHCIVTLLENISIYTTVSLWEFPQCIHHTRTCACVAQPPCTSMHTRASFKLLMVRRARSNTVDVHWHAPPQQPSGLVRRSDVPLSWTMVASACTCGSSQGLQVSSVPGTDSGSDRNCAQTQPAMLASPQ